MLAVSIAALGYGLDINFLYQKLETVQKQIINTKKQIQSKRRAMQQSKAARASAKLLLAPPVYTGEEIVNVLHILEKAIITAQVIPGLFEPNAIQENEWAMIFPIKLELSGKYKNLLIFINNVLLSPDIVTFEELCLQKKKEGDIDELNMQVLLRVYKNKHTTNVSIKELAIPILERDIFKPESYQKNIFIWSSRELQFLGIIRQAQAVFGVVGDPVGSIYQVMVGDKIGLNQSEIIAIDKCGITTAKQEDNIYRGGKCI